MVICDISMSRRMNFLHSMVLQADWDEEVVILEKDDDNNSVPGRLISLFTTFSSKALRGDDGFCQLSLRGCKY